MKASENESLLHQWFRRVWNEEDDAAIDELCTPDMTSHGLLETIQGVDAWKNRFYAPMRQAFTDVTVKMMDEGVCGDRLFGRLEATVTPRATGKPVIMKGFSLVRVDGGKVTEAWDAWDFLGLLEGMQLLPSGSFGRAISGALEKHPTA